MTPEQYERLPQVFKEKIELDKLVSSMKKEPVINFERGRNFILRQTTARYRCEQFLRKNKRTNLDNELA